MHSLKRNILARNVRYLRSQHRWSIRELASRADVAVTTVQNVEACRGCSQKTEDRLCEVFNVFRNTLYDDTLTNDVDHVVIRSSAARWHFNDRNEAITYHDRLIKSGENDRRLVFRDDPEGIQSEYERLRLGRAGFATAFIQPMVGSLTGTTYSAGLLEVFSEGKLRTADRDRYIIHVLRGPAIISLKNSSYKLETGECFAVTLCGDIHIGPGAHISIQEHPAKLFVTRLNGLEAQIPLN